MSCGWVSWKNSTSQIEIMSLSIGTPFTILTIDGVHKLSNCEYRNYLGDFFSYAKYVCRGEKTFLILMDVFLADIANSWQWRHILSKKISEIENSIKYSACHLRSFRVASTQIFFQGGSLKKVGCHTYKSEKKSGEHPPQKFG